MNKKIRALCAIFAVVFSLSAFSGCHVINAFLPPPEASSTDMETTENKGEDEYSPEISTVMPMISVTTSDNNEFATKYNSSDGVDYTDCTVSVGKCDEKYALTGVEAGIRVRGNATVTYPKKPFRIKFEKKQSMLGLNGGAKCKSWVLLAEYKDSSFLRNSVAYYLGNSILGADGLYCTDYRPVELYLNGEYWGVYLLAEQQQVDENRVNISEPEEDYEGTDIGYLIEYDGYYYGEAPLEQFTIGYNNKAPLTKLNGGTYTPDQFGFAIKSDIYSEAQKAFIATYTENAYTILYEAAYNDNYLAFDFDYTKLSKSGAKTAKETIEQAVNLNSLVDTYILNEICCDYDIGWSSFYLSVDVSADGDGRLTFQAPWDFDSSLGLKQEGLNFGRGMYAANENNPWLSVLIHEDWFMEMVKEKWAELNSKGVFKNALKIIKDFTKTYESYYEASFDKWGNVGIQLPDNLVAQVVVCKTQAEAADYLYRWLSARLTYLNDEFGNFKGLM